MASPSNNSVINHINWWQFSSFGWVSFGKHIASKHLFIFVCFLFSFLWLDCRVDLKIDFSQFNFPGEIWFSKPSAEIICKLLLLLPIILCGVIGNLLLLNIIIRNRALHTPTNYILANMISADTLTVIFCPVAFICSDFFQTFILGPIGCKMDGFLQGLIENNQVPDFGFCVQIKWFWFLMAGILSKWARRFYISSFFQWHFSWRPYLTYVLLAMIALQPLYCQWKSESRCEVQRWPWFSHGR